MNPNFTPRQQDMIRLLTEGHTLAAIGRRLRVSKATVTNDLAAAREATKTRSNTHLAVWWTRRRRVRERELWLRIDDAMRTLTTVTRDVWIREPERVRRQLLSDLSGGYPDDPRHDIPDPLADMRGAA